MAPKPDAALVLSPGQVLGNCRVISHLGTGGMGVVYLAEHLRLEKPVALKILPPDQMTDARVERFLREARVAALIEHANVVTIHDVGCQQGLYYIVMQYVQGKNLSELVREHGGPIPWPTALRIARFAASGLHAVHRRGQIHRDVKPGNIMLSHDGRVVLMDFGLVRGDDESSMTSTGVIVGTPSYMSPEQCRNEPLDALSDVYALGATLYNLLTATVPFQGSIAEVVRKVGSNATPVPVEVLNRSVPPAVAALVARTMAPRRSQRFHDARQLGKEIDRVLRAAHESVSEVMAVDRSETVMLAVAPLTVRSPGTLRKSRIELRSSWAPWALGLGALAIVLLAGLVINLLVPGTELAGAKPAAETNALADKSRMVFVPAGYARMGNTREQVMEPVNSQVETLLQQLSAIAPAAKITEARDELERSKLIDQLLTLTLEPVERASVSGFWIDAYEVTNAEYGRFVQATGHEPPESWSGDAPPAGREEWPVTGVRYRDAEAFARWAGKQLPTREQWVRAYRGDSDQLYPWGSSFHSLRATSMENSAGTPTAVTTTPEDVSAFKVYNLVGNVAELVRGKTTINGQSAVWVKGASFGDLGAVDGIGGFRRPLPAGSGDEKIGFRCVLEER